MTKLEELKAAWEAANANAAAAWEAAADTATVAYAAYDAYEEELKKTQEENSDD
jgi:hypothetical protein